MAEIGLRSGKIAPGLYRCGAYVIRKASLEWETFIAFGTEAENLINRSRSLSDAYNWCRRNPRKAAGGQS